MFPMSLACHFTVNVQVMAYIFITYNMFLVIKTLMLESIQPSNQNSIV